MANLDVMIEKGDTVFFYMGNDADPEYPVLVGEVVIDVNEATHTVIVSSNNEPYILPMERVLEVMTWEESLINHLSQEYVE